MVGLADATLHPPQQADDQARNDFARTERELLLLNVRPAVGPPSEQRLHAVRRFGNVFELDLGSVEDFFLKK